ncbi:uncharacterized protein SAPINGB_P004563 [Magnusiomyces paraingens]|uniref:t-SNARE coiled-coil homology domain-containing protein n=1 Tax=Magnusiomyces paraingens TaxID=2606893 RepID=A0A5E8BW92_9ASCO|nr:uncharacterized protein SAPINGB_P004563 [Saprochaete ingens]VVT55371.1 unnamed protein product [Saprochaete ingens]
MKFQTPFDNPYSQIDPNSQNQMAHEYEMDPYGGYAGTTAASAAAAASTGGPGITTGNRNSTVPRPDDMVAYFEEIEDLKKTIAEYDSNVDRIESLHQRSLVEVNDEQLQILNSQIRALVDETSALAKELRGRIQQLLNESQYDNTKRVQADNIKTQFQSSVRRYQGVESAFRNRYREQAERQYRTIKPEAPEEEVRAVVTQALEDPSGQGGQIFSQALLNSNRRGEAQAALGEVRARHEGILQIAKTMEELAGLFQDLETMVAEQAAAVDQVDVHVEQAQHDIERGLGETSGAVGYARKARRKKWICFGICVLVCLILALVLGLVFGLKNN